MHNFFGENVKTEEEQSAGNWSEEGRKSNNGGKAEKDGGEKREARGVSVVRGPGCRPIKVRAREQTSYSVPL